jgi:hypothetical protein
MISGVRLQSRKSRSDDQELATLLKELRSSEYQDRQPFKISRDVILRLIERMKNG